MRILRHYQHALKAGVRAAWDSGAQCVVGVTATGSGKTVTMASLAQDLPGRGIIQAHRGELVQQLSTAMAENGLRHNIIASDKTIRNVVDWHMDVVGKSMYDPRARWSVASVDTIIRRSAEPQDYVFTDEGHHVLEANKWGKAIAAYPGARSLLMTATPTRADGKGLGRHHDGLADAMVIGPGLRQLTDEGYLVPYDVAAPTTSDLDMSDVSVGPSGEFVQAQATRAVKRSTKIVGDCVEHYKSLASGKLAIGFAVDIEHAGKLVDAFNCAGIASALVTSDTSDSDRLQIMRKFRRRELLVLWNVDLFGEGVDVPGVEVVIMARPTASFSLFSQMIGRMLRLAVSPVLMAAWDTYTAGQRKQHIAESAKPRALLIDHVGNVYGTFKVGDHDYAGLPEGFAAWSLDRRGMRRSKPGEAIPVRKCPNNTCRMDYERVLDRCPFCGTVAPGPAQRGGPQHVDGNVFLLAPDVLARMRGEVVRLDAPPMIPQGVSAEIARAAAWSQQQRVNCQVALRDAIAFWAGQHPGKSDAELSRLFYYTFGMDPLSALSLGATPATKLKETIDAKFAGMGA